MSKCYGCMKYGVIYVAVLFLITGIAVVAVSTYLLSESDGYWDFARENEYFHYGKWMTFAAGCLMLLAGIFGCCGGLRQSSPMLSIFFAIVLLISLAELSAGVYSYIHRDDFINYFKKLMTNSVQNLYDRDEYATKAWDVIQQEGQCCGSNSFRDYNSNINHSPSHQDTIDMTLSAKMITSYTIPASCCYRPESVECAQGRKISLTSEIVSGTVVFEEGCAGKFIEWAKTKTSWVVGILIAIGSIQILCLLFTCILICAFRARRSYKH